VTAPESGRTQEGVYLITVEVSDTFGMGHAQLNERVRAACEAADLPIGRVGTRYERRPEKAERHGHHDCPDGPDAHEDYCLNGRQE
jgi:hypothetical protein